MVSLRLGLSTRTMVNSFASHRKPTKYPRKIPEDNNASLYLDHITLVKYRKWKLNIKTVSKRTSVVWSVDHWLATCWWTVKIEECGGGGNIYIPSERGSMWLACAWLSSTYIVFKAKRVLGYEMGCRLDLVNMVAHRQDIHCHIRVGRCMVKVARIHVRTGMRED